MTELERELENLGSPDVTAALEELGARTFIVDRDGVVRWQNAASIAAVGHLAGLRWTDVPLMHWAEDVRTFLARMISSGEPAEFSYEIVETDGHVATREISAAPLRDAETVVGIFGISTPLEAAPSPPSPPGNQLLTGRQLEILQMLADGKSTKDIAAELFLSKTTVRNHIAHLMANLGVHTRVQALVVASRAGMIRLP